MESFRLPLFPEGSLSMSVITTVYVGVCVVCFFFVVRAGQQRGAGQRQRGVTQRQARITPTAAQLVGQLSQERVVAFHLAGFEQVQLILVCRVLLSIADDPVGLPRPTCRRQRFRPAE